MGQLLNRIINFAKVNIDEDYNSESNIDNILSEQDRKLKSIINNLKTPSYEKENFDYKSELNNKPNPLEKEYKLFGVNSTSTNEEIKLAFKKKLKEYHPDKFVDKELEAQEEAKLKTQIIIEAYKKIMITTNQNQ